MPYNYITETGIIVPDTATTQEDVENEYKAIFGVDFVIDPESPEGVIIGAEIDQRDGLARNNADLANQINPNLSEGLFLDAIFALTDGERLGGLPTTFLTPPDVTGEPLTVIPAGSQAKTVNGDIFESTAVINLDGSGNGSGSFQSIEDGEIQVGIGELSEIVTAVLGWETINNTVAGTTGRDQEKDQAARLRRKQTLALQGRSLSEAVSSNVRAVDNVTSLAYRENNTSSGALIDGKFIEANSIYVCVSGGTDADVAAALLKSKTGGTGWTGTVVVPTIDEITGQSYDVKFDRPVDVPMEAVVEVSVGTAIVDAETAVKQSIVDYANGLIEGEGGFVVGASVSPFELGGAVNQENPGLFVRKVEVDSVASGTPATNVFPIEIFQQASITTSDISVVIV